MTSGFPKGSWLLLIICSNCDPKTALTLTGMNSRHNTTAHLSLSASFGCLLQSKDTECLKLLVTNVNIQLKMYVYTWNYNFKG